MQLKRMILWEDGRSMVIRKSKNKMFWSNIIVPLLASIFPLILGLSSCAKADTPSRELLYSYEVEKMPQLVSKSLDGLEVNIQRKPSRDGINYPTLTAAIKFPDGQFKISEVGSSPSYAKRAIWIGKIHLSDPMPSAAFSNYTGGNRCCSELYIATPVYGKIKTLEILTLFGSEIEDAFTDLNKDGSKDIVTFDTSFTGGFALYGYEQYPMPKVVTIYNGQFVDISADPDLKAYWTKEESEAGAACASPESSGNIGACAVYVAAAARAGHFETALSIAQTHVNSRSEPYKVCRYKVNSLSDCHEDATEEFQDFSGAMRLALRVNEYIDE